MKNKMDFEELTWREQEVLALLAERQTNREIATQLHLAESTVKDYVSNILGKLYVKNRRQAVKRGMELGLFDSDPRELDEPRSSLPAEATPFIGRAGELERIERQLSGTRLLTLTGPGGIGKTRLALKVAADCFDEFENGSRFVALANVQSVEEIVQTIAEALKLPLATEMDPRRQLLRYLKKKKLLMVIDNFEHMMAGVGIVSEILQAAPYVKIVTTSRERLNLQSETVLTVGGLTLADPDEPNQILHSDAASLFLQAARKIRPSFEPSLEALQKIAAICESVQGIPLAIELAAAWLQILSLDEIIVELAKSFDILSGERRDAPLRHRSIRSVFEHTWSLLLPSEQEIIKPLSVFRGGFTLVAARQVAGATLPLLAALANKSVLSYDPQTGRFEIHELLRQYILEQLDLRPQAKDAAYEAYADYFANFMKARWEHLKGDQQLVAIGEIEADIENIRSAWRYHVDKADAPHTQMYIHGLWLLYWIRGWIHAGVELFRSIVDSFSDLEADADIELLRSTAKANQGWFATWFGHPEQGYRLAQESVRSLEELNSVDGLVLAYHSLTLSAYHLNKVAEEKHAADRVLELSKSHVGTWALAHALAMNAMASMRVEELTEASRFAAAGLKLSDQIGDRVAALLSLNTLAHIALERGNIPEAKGHFLRSLGMVKPIGFQWATANVIKYLGQVALLEDNHSEAESYFLHSLAIAVDLGLDREIANHLFDFAKLRLAQGRAEETVELLQLLLQHPASEQARLGSGRINDSGQRLLAKIEDELPPDIFEAASQRGRNMVLDDSLSALLRSKEGDGGPPV